MPWRCSGILELLVAGCLCAAAVLGAPGMRLTVETDQLLGACRDRGVLTVLYDGASTCCTTSRPVTAGCSSAAPVIGPTGAAR